jgi:hypothetical protein
MTKKNFKKGFSGLLGEEPSKNKDTTPFTDSLTPSRDIHKEKRATFIVRTEQLDALKAIAFWERRLLKDILNDALSSYIFNYEKNNGKIKYPE